MDPTFANQTLLTSELTAINGQNQYGYGTNAKESFFALQTNVTSYAAGQRFNESHTMNAYGMGDAFISSLGINIWSGISASGDEGNAFWTTTMVHGVNNAYTPIVSVTTPATISTTLTQAVVGSKDVQAVTVASVVGVSAGQWITVDHDNAENIEAVKITAVGAGSISGRFRSNHDSGDSIKPATVLIITSSFAFGQGRPVINYTPASYSTGSAAPTAGSQTITGSGGASWTNGMVGGDSHIPGYIQFIDDNTMPLDLIRTWYPIVAIGSTTSLTISRLDVLGEAGYPANGLAIGGSTYTIRPGAKLLMFDGEADTIVLEYNPFTWTAGDNIECAHSANQEWTGLFLRFAPYMPGRYDSGINIYNSGSFYFSDALRVDATSASLWQIGINILKASTGIEISASSRAMSIIADTGVTSGNIDWYASGAAGPSLGPNLFLGQPQNNFVISTAGHTYPAGTSGTEAQEGVLSLQYGAPAFLRWNGNATINGTLDADGFSAGGTTGVATFGPSLVTSITVKNGIITAIS